LGENSNPQSISPHSALPGQFRFPIHFFPEQQRLAFFATGVWSVFILVSRPVSALLVSTENTNSRF
jgi:hypothetical protein